MGQLVLDDASWRNSRFGSTPYVPSSSTWTTQRPPRRAVSAGCPYGRYGYPDGTVLVGPVGPSHVPRGPFAWFQGVSSRRPACPGGLTSASQGDPYRDRLRLRVRCDGPPRSFRGLRARRLLPKWTSGTTAELTDSQRRRRQARSVLRSAARPVRGGERKKRHRHSGGRPPGFDRKVYRRRNTVDAPAKAPPPRSASTRGSRKWSGRAMPRW